MLNRTEEDNYILANLQCSARLHENNIMNASAAIFGHQGKKLQPAEFMIFSGQTKKFHGHCHGGHLAWTCSIHCAQAYIHANILHAPLRIGCLVL